MDFQIVSDLHLDSDSFNIPQTARYLFVAGDIACYQCVFFRAFINYVSERWEEVFYVLGNNEFYSEDTPIEDIEDYYTKIFMMFPNVHLLNKDVTEVNGITIMGCTLWICPTVYNSRMNCYRQINTRCGKLTLKNLQDLYYIDKDWILNNYDPEKPTILITHYPIINHILAKNLKYIRQSKDDEKYFHNDLDLPKPQAPLICISGHTHSSYDFSIGKTRYISNQAGCSGEKTYYEPERKWVLNP